MAEPLFKKLCQGSGKWRRIKPDSIKGAVLHDLTEPLVFRGYLSEGEAPSPRWNCMDWGASDWGELFGERELEFRIGPRVEGGPPLHAPQWETACMSASMTYLEFLRWAEGQGTHSTSCGREVGRDNHWAYLDYFYLRDVGIADRLGEALDWGVFGFPERGPRDSTLWMGTAGANTPCHVDTYGCNLVAQVVGRKRWTLFPESQSGFLYPTRVPYEESSIYSEVGFPRPSLALHPGLRSSAPSVVELGPGDALFVPRRWWHFVENLDFAVSVNTWLELPSDEEERLKESLVMYQVGSLCQGIHSLDFIGSVFNPNMTDVATMASDELLGLLVHRVFSGEAPSNGLSSERSGTAGRSLPSKDDEADNEPESIHLESEKWCVDHNVARVPSMSYSDYMSKVLGCPNEWTESETLLDEAVDSSDKKDSCERGIKFSQIRFLINAFADQRVIDVLKKVIDEKLVRK